MVRRRRTGVFERRGALSNSEWLNGGTPPPEGSGLALEFVVGVVGSTFLIIEGERGLAMLVRLPPPPPPREGVLGFVGVLFRALGWM